jgi:hypothetical protein
MCFRYFILCSAAFVLGYSACAQHSVARQWNEVMLEAVKNDYARPTVHARNLFHVSMAMYDAWAAYEEVAKPFLLGNTLDTFYSPFTGVDFQSLTPPTRRESKETAISYAAYRLLRHRFLYSPGAATSLPLMDTLMNHLGYSTAFVSTNYTGGSSAALGNYIAQQYILFGAQDGSNEQNDYANLNYQPLNPDLFPDFPGNPSIVYPNRWQPLSLDTFIDQSGNPFSTNTPDFLSAEWGRVFPFAIHDSLLSVQAIYGDTTIVAYDPGSPPRIDSFDTYGQNAAYKWNFSLVALWSAHLDPSDTTLIDISPESDGNTTAYPNTLTEYQNFYSTFQGGQQSNGYSTNPITGQAYTPQFVKRGDYTRVLAEFWADGPDSETPPGHWFSILNYVSDHPLATKKWAGNGSSLDDLEWDVKAYFTLAGAMQDAAIAAWSIKGTYDYVRPISAIRYMAAMGQCSDSLATNFSTMGIPLHPGYIESVDTGDVLQGASYEHIGKIKVRAWKGPDSVGNPATDIAGVGWILVENWWPYQRPSFVTPPFAGYVSGHSTYSRAAAEVLTAITGDAYFPGGMGQFFAPFNNFLVFEEGPSQNILLQWATYRDAADQCGLSRIWGGIHPPVDDIPGRIIGEKIGLRAFDFSQHFFDANALTILPDIGICDHDSILIFGQTVNQADHYYQYLQSANGNDSFVIQPLLIYPSYTIDLSPLRVCANDSILVFGNYQQQAATYIDTLTTLYGCRLVMRQELSVDSLSPVFLAGFSQDTVCVGVGLVPLPNGIPTGGSYAGAGLNGSFFDPDLAGTGTQTVVYMYTNNQQCTSADSAAITVEICTALEHASSFHSLQVFPNPSPGLFTLHLPQRSLVQQISVFNMAQQKMPFYIDRNTATDFGVNIRHLQQGVYVVQVQTTKALYVQKIIKY